MIGSNLKENLATAVDSLQLSACGFPDKPSQAIDALMDSFSSIIYVCQENIICIYREQ